MTLKEKFINYVYCFMGSGMLTNTYDEDIANWNAEFCEKIADEFAIEFAKWIKDDGRTIELLKGSRTPKELLEIYKKEKGL